MYTFLRVYWKGQAAHEYKHTLRIRKKVLRESVANHIEELLTRIYTLLLSSNRGIKTGTLSTQWLSPGGPD